MAGPLLLHGDTLYRPAQDCKSRYGAQVVLYRVDLLSPDGYRETEAAILPPDAASSFGLAMHTVVWFEGLFATDGIRQIPISGIGSKMMTKVKMLAMTAERIVANSEAFLS